MTDKILTTLTDMNESGDSNCAERALLLREEWDAYSKSRTCSIVNKREDMNKCFYPKAIIDQIMDDVDVLQFKRICEKYRPQLEYISQDCRKSLKR
jgi:hypothetical protein